MEVWRPVTYFEINWLLFSKPLTNLFVVGVNSRHVGILQSDVYENLMIPPKRMKRGFISLRNGSTVTFVLAEDLDEKTRGYSNVEVVYGDNITADKAS